MSRPFIDFDDVSSGSTDSNVINCYTHGDYPASMKSYGCPECVKEREEEEAEGEMLLNSRIRRVNGKR